MKELRKELRKESLIETMIIRCFNLSVPDTVLDDAEAKNAAGFRKNSQILFVPDTFGEG